MIPKKKSHTHTNGLICLGFKNFNMVKITISFLNFIIVFYFNTFVSFLSLSHFDFDYINIYANNTRTISIAFVLSISQSSPSYIVI